MQKNGVGIVVYVGEELGAVVLLSVASKPVMLPAWMLVMVLLRPAAEVPSCPVNLKRQFAEVLPRFTVPVYVNFLTPGIVPVVDTQVVLLSCVGQTGVTSNPFEGLCIVRNIVCVRLNPLYISISGVAVDKDWKGGLVRLQSPYITSVTL
jgi:hypothetical protein